jgi:uncharacterized protein YyaL (SSP411 family)
LSNKLSAERSPYLQMHKDNPVNWYPWCSEAFEIAQRENKPVFISIGYSACHWCHVVADESFSNPDFAAVANRFFVCIKVDKEEHPAVDTVYMNACQLLTGRGGWPLNVLATPDGKPFFAFTYLPRDRMSSLLANVAMGWHQNKASYEKTAAIVTDRMERLAHSVHPTQPTARLWENQFQRLRSSFDREFGGFGEAPKFPSPQNLLFLLEYHRYTGDELALHMAELTLTCMYRGGIFDHIGGGFCRYSTDARWQVPHFEKMLYDNAMLVYTYAEAYARTGNALYRIAAERSADYVIRELGSPTGGFFSSQNADSDGEEGKYYALTPDEVESVLGKNDAQVFCLHYRITHPGNFEGRNIPNLIGEDSPEEDSELMSDLRADIYRFRLERSRLSRDEKILTAWNGMMIAALAKAGRVFGKEKYLNAAMEAEEFIRDALTRRGRLLLRWQSGEAKFAGCLEDYVYYAWALTELADSGCGPEYARAARDVMDTVEELFADPSEGGYFYCTDDDKHLPVRPKEVWDGAYPSGNAVALYVLLKLQKDDPDPALAERAQRQMAFLSGAARSYDCPFALTAMMKFAGERVRQ